MKCYTLLHRLDLVSHHLHCWCIKRRSLLTASWTAEIITASKTRFNVDIVKQVLFYKRFENLGTSFAHLSSLTSIFNLFFFFLSLCSQVSNLQKTLKASAASPSSGPPPAGAASNQDADQPAEPRDPASSQEPRQPGKKSSKVKGWVLRHHPRCVYCDYVATRREGGMNEFSVHLGCYGFLYKRNTLSLHINCNHFSTARPNILEIQHIKYVWPCRIISWNDVLFRIVGALLN